MVLNNTSKELVSRPNCDLPKLLWWTKKLPSRQSAHQSAWFFCLPSSPDCNFLRYFKLCLNMMKMFYTKKIVDTRIKYEKKSTVSFRDRAIETRRSDGLLWVPRKLFTVRIWNGAHKICLHLHYHLLSTIGLVNSSILNCVSVSADKDNSQSIKTLGNLKV